MVPVEQRRDLVEHPAPVRDDALRQPAHVVGPHADVVEAAAGHVALEAVQLVRPRRRVRHLDELHPAALVREEHREARVVERRGVDFEDGRCGGLEAAVLVGGQKLLEA